MPKTLIPPPADDASKAPIENVLELTSLKIIDKDLFTNTRPLWHPPGARGIYGGAAIAQSLAAAQLTIPAPSAANNHSKFYVHSMHCYFVLAGNADIPVIYSVERVREGRSFMTRTVQARQEGRCIFTTTLSFAKADEGGKWDTVRHEAALPEGVVDGLELILAEEEEKEKGRRRGGDAAEGEEERERRRDAAGPFEHRRIALTNGEYSVASRFEQRVKWHREDGDGDGSAMSASTSESGTASRSGSSHKTRSVNRQSEYIRRDWGGWGDTIPPSKASVKIGDWTLEDPLNAGEKYSGMTSGGMTEKLWRRDPVEVVRVDGAASKRPETKRTHQWVKARGKITAAAGQEAHLSALAYMSDSWFIGTVARVQNLWRFSSPRATIKGSDEEPSSSSSSPSSPPKSTPTAPTTIKSQGDHATDMAKLEEVENEGSKGPARSIGMMVSLDHSIYFHKPAAIKADEWLFQEMESPWAGDGRGLVFQKVWNRKGELLATCIQEGVVRLQQNKEKGKL